MSFLRQAEDAEQSETTLVLAQCAKFHRGKWDMVLLQVHSQNAHLMAEGMLVTAE